MKIDKNVNIEDEELKDIIKILNLQRFIILIISPGLLIYHFSIDGNYAILNILFYYIPMIIIGFFGCKLYANYGVSYNKPMYGLGKGKLVAGITGFLIFLSYSLLIFGGVFMIFYDILINF